MKTYIILSVLLIISIAVALLRTKSNKQYIPPMVIPIDPLYGPQLVHVGSATAGGSNDHYQ